VKVRVLPLQQFWLKRIRRLPGIVPFGIESLRKKLPGIRGIQKGETDIYAGNHLIQKGNNRQ